MQSIASRAPQDDALAPRIQLPQLELWVASLPFANPAAVISSLSFEVAHLGSVEIKHPLRLKLLEVHAGAYDRLADSFTRSPAGARARERRRSTMADARNLTMLLADGYASLVTELSGKGRGWLTGLKPLATAAQRQTVFLTHALLHGYDEYTAAAPQVWVELERLYRLATEERFAERASRGDWARSEFNASITHLYKRALLTGLADPHRFGPGEIWRVYDLLGESADAAVITRGNPDAEQHGVFVIDSQDIRHGACLGHLRAGSSATQTQLLDARPVIEALRNKLDALRATRTASAVEARARREQLSILRRVVKTLDSPRQRDPQRRRSSDTIRLAIGIGATHEALGAPGSSRSRATFEARAAGRAAANAGDGQNRSDSMKMKMIDPRSGATVDVAAQRAAAAGRGKQAAGVDHAPAFKLDEWEVVDRSPNGIGIVKRGRPAVALSVGEPVAFCAPSKPWVVGVVRWLVVDGSQKHRAGVEVLSGTPVPVEVRAISSGVEADARSALMLTTADGSATGTMIAFPGTYADGRTYRVQGFGDVSPRRLRATALVDTTAVCEVLEFEDLGVMPVTAPSKPPA